MGVRQLGPLPGCSLGRRRAQSGVWAGCLCLGPTLPCPRYLRCQEGVAGGPGEGPGVSSWPARSRRPHRRRQRTSWSPTRTPRPSFCRARASRWIWKRTARTPASTSSFCTCATSCGACEANPALAPGLPSQGALRYPGCSGFDNGAGEGSQHGAWLLPLGRLGVARGGGGPWGLPPWRAAGHLRPLSLSPHPQGPQHTPEGPPGGHSCPLVSRGAREAGQLRPPPPPAGTPRAQGPPGRQSRGGPQAGVLHVDSSCLLTPPGTPLGLEPAVPDWPETGGTCGKALPEGRRSGQSGPGGAAGEGKTCPQAPDSPQYPPGHLGGAPLGHCSRAALGARLAWASGTCPRTPEARAGQAPGAP